MNNEKRKKSGHSAIFWVLIIAAIAAVIAVIIIVFTSNRPENPETAATTTQEGTESSAPETTEVNIEQVPSAGTAEPAESTAEPVPQGLQLPYETEGLEIRSCFPSTIPNPDGGNTAGDDISSIEVLNQSGGYLKHAELTVSLTDGTEYSFIIEDMPEGKTVWAFDLESRSYDGKVQPGAITCTAVEREAPEAGLQETVTATASGMEITVTNNGAEDLGALDIVCKCNFGDSYFGGISYSYRVESLAAGESKTFSAEDCYLGEAEVVCIRRAE